ncbi:hypothetical protein [Streptomyces poriticola]|uniref:hypothetical protein n=1 Tax=Streptomyces poriticola TaxID=3120506 RepID=UPI002FCE3CE5
MHNHPHHESDACVEDLRTALAANGITLPSLGVDLLCFANAHPHTAPPLVALGNCNTATAQALAAALRKAAGR